MRRKTLLSKDMSLISGMDRSSPEYLKALEDELSQLRVTKDSLEDELDNYKSDVASGKAKSANLDTTLQLITDRLSNLETSVANLPPPPAVQPALSPPAHQPTDPRTRRHRLTHRPQWYHQHKLLHRHSQRRLPSTPCNLKPAAILRAQDKLSLFLVRWGYHQ